LNLQKNLNRNNAPNVMAICAGIWNEAVNSAELFLKKRHSGAASLTNTYGGGSVRISILNPAMLRAITPDDAYFTIKVDVEGAELNVIVALVDAGILQRTDRLVIEMSQDTNSAENLDQIRKVLAAHGLSLYARHGTLQYGDEIYLRTKNL